MAVIPTFENFRRALQGTPMAAEARGIYDTALRGGINPALVVGIAGAESNFGKLGYAVGRHNPYGLMGFSFSNYTQATQKLVTTLNSSGLGYRQAYKRSGLNGMINIYTPRGAANGPNNDPDAHTRHIISIGRRTGGDPAQAYVTGGAPAAGATTGGAATATGTVAGGIDTSALLGLMRQQAARMRAGQGYDPALGKQIREQVVAGIGSGNIGGGAVPSSAVTGGGAADIPSTGNQKPLSRWGGPSDHGARALGNWQSDLAWDLGGPTGTPIRSPLGGRVVKISGRPGGDPQFAGYGVTVDFGGGRQAFFKHLGSLGPGVKVGARLGRGSLIGGLDSHTGGGPHLHLGANSSGFLQSLLSYYGGR